MSEHEIEQFEDAFPAMAAHAFAAAREAALAAGQSVVESLDGVIYEVFPDGRREVVKHIAPPVRVKPGRINIICELAHAANKDVSPRSQTPVWEREKREKKRSVSVLDQTTHAR